MKSALKTRKSMDSPYSGFEDDAFSRTNDSRNAILYRIPDQ